MLNYQQKEQYIAVKWKRKEIGRIFRESGLWVYKPRGCDGKVVSDGFKSLTQLKQYLEGEE
jgi:hypothetical protein